MKRLHLRPLSIEDILSWANAHREATGKWPTRSSGPVVGDKFETWAQVDRALREGLRGLPGGSSLAQLLAEKRGARNIKGLASLTEKQVLHWADEHHRRTGEWPTAKAGLVIPDSGGEKWASIDMALRNGARGFAGGSSLARLLAEQRGVRNRKGLPALSENQILAWADSYHQRTGTWPTAKSGSIEDAPGETWLAADMALRHGQRGMPGGSSVAMLLADRRGVRNTWTIPNFSIPQILAWAEAFHERTGGWPNLQSGPIVEAPEETWHAVNKALTNGGRGLPGGYSLAELLARERGARNKVNIPNLTRQQILAWADAHRRRTGEWPTKDSGPIADAAEETWAAVDAALYQGSRGLRPGSSLARLLAQYRHRKNHLGQPRLTKKKILAWADRHHEHTGQWPNVNSGAVVEAPEERWDLIDNALRQGHRGQPGGSSLLLLLVKKRGVRNPLKLPPLTQEQILRWARCHWEQTGGWPKYNSGAIADAPGETWAGMDSALRYGKRELVGGSSLAKVLGKDRKE